MTANVDIVIPARYASTRFPGKSLVAIKGKPMIERVYERASQAKLARKVIVATDDQRIAQDNTLYSGRNMRPKCINGLKRRQIGCRVSAGNEAGYQ